MSMVEKVRDFVSKSAESAVQAYRKLVKAAADEKGSPESAFPIIEAAGKSVDQFEEDLQLLKQRRKWAEDIAKASAAELEIIKPDADLKRAETEYAQAGLEVLQMQDSASKTELKKKSLNAFLDAADRARTRMHNLNATIAAGSFARNSLRETADESLQARERELCERLRSLNVDRHEKRWREESDRLASEKARHPNHDFQNLEGSVKHLHRQYTEARKEFEKLTVERDANTAAMLEP